MIGLAQDALVGLAGGALVDCLWGQAQADVGCSMAALPPDSAMVMGLWRELSAAVAVLGAVGELTPQPAAAVAKHECTLLHLHTLNSWQNTAEGLGADKSNYKQSITPNMCGRT